MSENIIKVLTEIITTKTDRSELDKLRYCFEVVNQLLSLEDSVQKKRTKMFIVPFLGTTSRTMLY